LEQRFVSAAHRTAAVTCAVFFAAGLTLAALGPNLPALATRMGVDSAALGGLFTAFSIGVIATQFAVGSVCRRFGQRATLATGMVLMGLGELAIAQASALPVVFVAALLAGAGFGSIMSTGNTLVAQLFPLNSAAALNGANLFFGVGAIVGPSVVAAANTRFGAPQIGLIVGASALVALAPIVIIAAASSTSDSREQSAIRATIPTRSWLLGSLLLVYTGTEIGVGAWLTLYMINSGSLGSAQAPLALAAFWVALTSGRALAATIGGRTSVHSLLWLCLGGLLLGAIVFALGIGNVSLTLAAVLIFGLSCGPVFPTVLALVAAGTDSGPATSRVLVLANFGGMLLPALLGMVLAQLGPMAAAGQLIVAALAMIGLGAAAMRPRRLVPVPADADCAPVC
jgi:fucose permease